MRKSFKPLYFFLFAVSLSFVFNAYAVSQKVETIKIYDNGIREVVKDGQSFYYESMEGVLTALSAKEAASKIKSSTVLVEADILQFGTNKENIDIFIGGYSPTMLVGDVWNRNQFTDTNIQNLMDTKEGISVVVSYNTHLDYGGPETKPNKNISDAFKNLMGQLQNEKVVIGSKNPNISITSYSTGHYLALDYLTDKKHKGLSITRYKAIAPNTNGSDLAYKYQNIFSPSWKDMIPNNEYMKAVNNRDYFSENTQVEIFLSEQDIEQWSNPVVYYNKEKSKEDVLKDFAEEYTKMIKQDLKIYIIEDTLHANTDKLFISQISNLIYYVKDQGEKLILGGPTEALEYKKDQLTLQRNIKKNTLTGVLKNAPCGAKTTEITVLQDEINSINQEIGEIEGQINSY